MSALEAGLRAPVSVSFWEQKAKRLEADNAWLSSQVEQLEMQVDDLKRELNIARDDELHDTFVQAFTLTPLEAKMLVSLYLAGGVVVSKERMMLALYGNAADTPEIKIVDVLACKLRRKIHSDLIITAWGKGYLLSPAGLNTCRVALGLPASEIVVSPAPGRASKSRRSGKAARILAVLKPDEWMTAAAVAEHVKDAATTDVSTVLGVHGRRHGRVEIRRNMVGAKSITNHYRLTEVGRLWLADQRERGVL